MPDRMDFSSAADLRRRISSIRRFEIDRLSSKPDEAASEASSSGKSNSSAMFILMDTKSWSRDGGKCSEGENKLTFFEHGNQALVGIKRRAVERFSIFRYGLAVWAKGELSVMYAVGERANLDGKGVDSYAWHFIVCI